VPFASDDEVLLIRQYRHAAGSTLYEVPAGKLDPGDTPETCAARELEEEAGARAGRLEKLGWIFTTPGFSDEVIHLFAAFEIEEVPTRHEPDEVIEVVRMPLADALDLVWSGELTDAKSALALVHAAHRVGRLV
jgi:ADP-ribose pyrophosphatase